MNTPDRRLIATLTPEILSSSSHWCICWSDKALTVPSREITVFSTSIDAYGLSFGTGSESKTTCYPCTLQPNGLVVPESWPVMDGEEEIEEWRGITIPLDQLQPVYWRYQWHLRDYRGEIVTRRVGVLAGPDRHPAPRKGEDGPVWVWEKDKC